MAVIFKFKTKTGVTHYYGDLVVKGKRYRRFLGLSRKVAKLALQDLEYELRYGKEEEEIIPITYSQAILKFLSQVELTGTSKAQIKYISSRLNRFRQFCSKHGVSDIDKITQENAISFMTARTKEHITNAYDFGKKKMWKHPAPSTINRDIGFQKRFFRFCTDSGWIKINPWATIARLSDKEGMKQRYSFSKSELDSIFEISGLFTDFYFVLLHTGIRPTDAFVLKSDAFTDTGLTMRQRKTGDWLRNIPVSQAVTDRLCGRLNNNDYIFPELQSDMEKRKTRILIQSLFEPEFVRENNINLHTFRHTYAHLMLNKGMPKEVLQTFLGHRSIRTTEIYANWVNNVELAKWVT